MSVPTREPRPRDKTSSISEPIRGGNLGEKIHINPVSVADRLMDIQTKLIIE